MKKVYRLLILWAQNDAFSQDIAHLRSNSTIHSSINIASLTPFLDEEGILRVAGRLTNACVAYNVKHPVILPKRHVFVKHLITHLHEKYLHAGVSLLINIIRQEYWIVSCRSEVKSVINKCVTCMRQRAITSQQLMADLPKHRVGAYRPFEITGVDYAGPLHLLIRRGRGAKTVKGYLALFICFSTRAIHLELAGDLSSETFLSCLKRFVSRRGIPAVIYSDNGTNFVGASKYLNKLHELITSIYKNDSILRFIEFSKISWKFNPPSSPHFGGLWKAGIKSVKSILHRVIGDTKLTYEEMSTLITQIEGLLNSRPLVPASDDISSLDALTPAHFLIGQPLTVLPESSICESMVLQDRWKLMHRMHIDFWKRWHQEYLTMLQQRPKWQKMNQNLRVGDMVVLKENNVPPAKWLLGRIVETHPGRDNLVRVAKVKTMYGTIQRPTIKLVKLPVNCDSG